MISLRITEYLNEKQKKQLDEMKKDEKVNWNEMMGTNRQTYKRVRGKIRRK